MTQTKHAPGQIVKARVTRILPYFGLLVRLEDGSRGFIRRRELSWSEKEPHPGKFAHVGQEIEAVILDRDAATGNLSLSLRLRQHDPWTEIEKRYPVGKEVQGVVTRILPDRGAFVELERGLDGFIPISFIDPERKIENVEDVLWVDDHVRALVVEVEARTKTIHLSVKAYLQRRRRERIQEISVAPAGAAIEDIIDQKTRELLYQAVLESDRCETPLVQPNRIRRILIIDDIVEFGQPLADWLGQKGYEVKLALTGKEGLDFSGQETFDLIFLDSHLPDTTGIEVAEKINAARPELPILLVTGYEDEMDMERAAKIEVPIWFKPMAEQDLIEILNTLENTGHLPAMAASAHEKQLDFLQPGIESLATRRGLSKTLQTILGELSREVGVKSLALFRVDAKKREVTLEASQGVPPLSDEHSYNLIYSPVQDVIETNRLVYQSQVSPRRFKYLLKWMSFQSCAGFPVPALHREVSHALFLFDSRPRRFDRAQLARAQAVATFVGAALAFEQTESQLQAVQQLILKGQLAAGILHEVHNRLGGALLTAKLLHGDFEDLRHQPQKDWFKTQEHARSLQENLDTISESIKLFRRLSREESWEEIDINQALHRTADLLRPLAIKNKIDLKLEFDDKMPHLHSVGVRLDQVFCNILLNAIEWMAPKPGACLTISSRFVPENFKRPVQIRFCDAGPGIHRHHFDSIYELGFTTKNGGTGLGLFIAKGLAESVGGNILVEESIILVGTTFLVELPLRLSGKNQK